MSKVFEVFDITSIYAIEHHTVGFWHSLYYLNDGKDIKAGIFNVSITVADKYEGTDGKPFPVMEISVNNRHGLVATYAVPPSQFTLDKCLSGYRIS